MVVILAINPVEQKKNLLGNTADHHQENNIYSGQQDVSCSRSSSNSSAGAVGLKGSKASSSFQQSLFNFTRLKRREHELESKNGNRASNVKSLHLPSSKMEIPIFKIKETPEVEELQKKKKLFAETLGKNYPSVDLCLVFTGEKLLSWIYDSFCLCSLAICPPLSVFLRNTGKNRDEGRINLQAPCGFCFSIITSHSS